MSDNTTHDDKLAAYTDELLDGQVPHPPDDIDELADAVRQLQQTIDPATPPTPAFRQRLRAHLSEVWDADARHAPRHIRRPRWYRNRVFQVAALAASLLVLLLAVALLSEQAATGKESLEGTATGATGWVFGAVLAVGVVALLVIWWHRRRQP